MCHKSLKPVDWKKLSVEFATVFEMLASMNLKPIVLQAVLF